MWSELERVALLGTQREPIPEVEGESPLADFMRQFLRQTEADSPERALLNLAGSAHLYEQTGELPQQLRPQMVRALGRNKPPEQSAETKLLSTKSARYLQRLNGSTLGDLLPEFLQTMTTLSLSLPPEQLPELIDRGMRVARFRTDVMSVIGETGQWLAAQNHKWRYAAPISADWDALLNEWHVGSMAEKQHLLRKLRERRPELSRELLNAVWRSTEEKRRFWYIKQLEMHLSAEDEQFLEKALDDRAANVRKKAVELLGKLPNARYAERMQRYAEHILRWHPQGKHKIVPYFPKEISAEMVRDGISEQTAPNMARIREAQLKLIIGATPLTFWTETWGVSAETIVRAINSTNWPRTLKTAFATATIRQENHEWAKALIDVIKLDVSTYQLVSLLTPTEFEELLAFLLASAVETPLSKENPLVRLLNYWKQPLTLAMTKTYLDAILQEYAQLDKLKAIAPMQRRMLKRLPLLIAPEHAELVADSLLPTLQSAHWRPTAQTLVTTLRLRAEILETLSADAAA